MLCLCACSVQQLSRCSRPLLSRCAHGRLCIHRLPSLPVGYQNGAPIRFKEIQLITNRCSLFRPVLQAVQGIPPCSEANVGPHLLPRGQGSRGASKGDAAPLQGGDPPPAD